LRIWDLFFYEGSVILFRVALAMIRMHEPNLKELQNSADIFNSLSDLPRQVMI
jgi:small G protein signaling modulator 3